MSIQALELKLKYARHFGIIQSVIRIKKVSFTNMQQQPIKSPAISIHTLIYSKSNQKYRTSPKIYSIFFLQNAFKFQCLSANPCLFAYFCMRQWMTSAWFNSCLRGRNIIFTMQVQTLALQLSLKPTPQTLIAIMQEFAPKGLSLKDGRLLVLVDDPQACASLIEKVKSGAYFELKREVFEILDPAANTSSLLESSSAVFETVDQVRHFFQIPTQIGVERKEPTSHEEEAKAKLEPHAEEQVRIDLLDSLYEPSGKIEVDFSETAFQSMDSPAPQSIEREVASSEEFVNAFSHESVEVVVEEEKESFGHNATNTQEQGHGKPLETGRQLEKQKETGDEPSSHALPAPSASPAATSHSPSSPAKPHTATSAFVTAVLLLWVYWLII